MALTDNIRGALLMVGSMTAFTVNDVCMKALSDELPLFQALFIRSVIVIICLVLIALGSGRLVMRFPTKDYRLIMLRTLSEVGAAFFFITALFNMPIANVTAVIQTLPLTVTLAGAVFLKEPVGWKRLSAILIGFVGVLLIIRPGGDGFSIYSVYVLLAVGCVTVRDLAARQMSYGVPSIMVALAAAVGVLLFSGVGVLTSEWRPVSNVATLQLGGAAFFVIGGYIFSVAAMRVGEISVVAPFRYTSLIVALVFGYLVFGEWPDNLTLVGAMIIVGTGVFTLYRGRAVRKRPA